jgi:hypothetical protein
MWPITQAPDEARINVQPPAQEPPTSHEPRERLCRKMLRRQQE